MRSVIYLIGILITSCTMNAQNLKKTFITEVEKGFAQQSKYDTSLLSEADMQHLPEIVQKYLSYTGSTGNAKVHNVKITFKGKIRANPEDGWMNLQALQYSFFDDPTRLFYIKARKMGIPASGLHAYANEQAIMKIKMAGLFTVQDIADPRLDQAETVTHFNDMCLLAPATLIDKRITWEEVNDTTVDAAFTNDKITISARLCFNKEGALVNFISNDRYEIQGDNYTNRPFKTPVEDYMEYNGRRVITKGQAVYERPDADFVYGIFELDKIEYNVGHDRENLF